MKKNNKFGTVMSISVSVIMGFVMAVTAIIVNKIPFGLGVLLKNACISILVVFLISLFIPYRKLGEQFAGLFPVKHGSLPFQLISNIVPSLIINTFNTIIISGANILTNPGIPAAARMGIWGSAIVKGFPIMFLVAYIASFFAQKIAFAFTSRFFKRPDGARPPKM
ncbi:MAG: hypothetical protein IJ719_12145 [Clostridia bacterium]|nr:hypothetical protein [Clostridia bacterium]